MRERKIRRRKPLKDAVAREIERRSTDDHGGGRKIGMAIVATGMMQHQFIANRDHDDARYDRNLEIRVAAASHATRIGRRRDLPARSFGADIEIDLPHRHAAEERY